MATFQGKRVSKQWDVVLTEAAQHVRFQLNSGQRTLAEQWRLYRLYRSGRGNLAAFPNPNAPHIRTGRPNHALDVNSLDGGETRLQNWLRARGARANNTVRGESWHLEVPAADLRKLYNRYKHEFNLRKELQQLRNRAARNRGRWSARAKRRAERIKAWLRKNG